MTKTKEIVFTICPVVAASHVALSKGFLKEELGKVGVTPKYLYSLDSSNWISHFKHTLPNSFRDGGNIPAIWTKSNGTKIKLIGLTYSNAGGQILVRTDSEIYRVADLKGKKFGLSKRILEDRVDFWRITGHRGILVAAELAGLKPNDFKIVDLPVDGTGYDSLEPVASPELRFKNHHSSSLYKAEVEALLSGKVDAIYSNHGAAAVLTATGKVKSIEDFSRRPDWTLQVANSPYTIAVNEDLAKNQPEVVVAYLKAAVKAGRWINENPEAAAEIFTKVTSFSDPKVVAKLLKKLDLVPSLSEKNITGIEIEKKFLLDHGYIKNDFDAREWADDSFLKEALA